jgi:glycerate kinase
MLKEAERNPLKTTTYGLGQLILDAVNNGYKNVYVTLGGSATNDGGLGALTALGHKFIKNDGAIAKGVGEELGEIVAIDATNATDLSGVNFTILCDVNNPLLGEKGASRVFAPQKGANTQQVEFLEKGMQNWCKVISSHFNTDANAIVGGGAAGGLGASLTLFLNAQIKSGIQTVLDLINFDEALAGATAVITGEGRIDGQSIDGKVISGVCKRAHQLGVPVIAIVGGAEGDMTEAYDKGVSAIFTINRLPQDFSISRYQSEQNLEFAVDNILRAIKF